MEGEILGLCLISKGLSDFELFNVSVDEIERD